MEQNPKEYMQLLRIIHCLGWDEFNAMIEQVIDFEVDYMEHEYRSMQRDLFGWLALRTNEELEGIFEYAEHKRIIWALKREAK